MQEVYFRPLSNDGTCDGTALEKWNTKVVEGAKLLGKDWWCAPHYAQVILLPLPISHTLELGSKTNKLDI
jgi:hypothetical protein